MEINDVPQHNSKIFNGQRKVIYATRDGHYQTATSTGWQDEEFATEQAVQELTEQTEQALQLVKCGEKSPIFYLMYKYRFDLAGLAQATGLWQWQIKRHFRPEIFAKISDRTLAKYGEVFQLNIYDLKLLDKI